MYIFYFYYFIGKGKEIYEKFETFSHGLFEYWWKLFVSTFETNVADFFWHPFAQKWDPDPEFRKFRFWTLHVATNVGRLPSWHQSWLLWFKYLFCCVSRFSSECDPTAGRVAAGGGRHSGHAVPASRQVAIHIHPTLQRPEHWFLVCEIVRFIKF